MGHRRPRWETYPVTENDMTVMLFTLNKVPNHWAEFHKRKLLEAIGDMPLLVCSKRITDWQRPNTTYLLQEEPGEGFRERLMNIYDCHVRALEIVKTPYVAIMDDDSLYPPSHFRTFRPALDGFGHNNCRWITSEWVRDKPFYYHTPTPDNTTLIAGTERYLAIVKSIFNNFAHTDDLMHGTVWYTDEPVVQVNHDFGLAGKDKRKWKRPWPVRAFSIPVWGPVENILKEWDWQDG